MQITTNILDLSNLVNAAMLFCAKNNDLEAIYGVHLERFNDELLAVSSDRFSLGVSSVPAQYSDVGTWSTFIGYEDMRSLKLVLKSFGTAKKRRESLPVTLTHAADTMTVSLPSQDLTLTAHTNPSFPDWRKLLDSVDTYGHRAEFAPLNLDKFGRVDLLRNNSDRALMEVGAPGKPTRVTISDYFVGLLMPCTQSNTESTLYDRLKNEEPNADTSTD